MNVRWKLAPVIVLAAITTAACGGASSGTSSTSTSASSVPTSIKIGISSLITGFDPFNDLGGGGDQTTKLYGGQLMSLDAGGNPTINQLAKSLTESKDRKSWTAILRPGLKFADGTPLKASDVKASFAYAKAQSGPTGKFVLYDTISSIDTPNDTTVVFNLAHPTSLIPALLADPGSTIWPAADLAKGKKFFQKPTSAGPYEIQSFDPVSGRTVFVGNPNYWGTKPKVQTITYTVVPSDTTRLQQLKSGTIDYAENFAPSLKSQITGPGISAQTSFSYGQASWFVFSDDSPITGNKNVRHAINIAINRQQIINTAYAGVGTPLNGLPWDQSDLKSNDVPIKQDVAKAKLLLAGTPCANGCTLKVVSPVSGNNTTDPTGLVMQQQLKAIGISLKIEPTPIANVVATIKQPNFDAYDSGASVGNPSPITIALEEADPTADIFSSYALKYRAPQMHTLVQQLVSAPQSEVPGIAAKIDTQFDKDLPWLSLFAIPAVSGSRLPASVISVGLGGILTIK